MLCSSDTITEESGGTSICKDGCTDDFKSWSALDLRNRFSDDTSPAAEDLDVLDLEEREKLLRHMWDACVHGRHMTLESFWQEAFVAAFDERRPEVRQEAITEIAQMSARYTSIDPPPVHSSVSLGIRSFI